MNTDRMMTYFCVAYGPEAVSLEGPAHASAFRRANPMGASVGPVAGVTMIHRDIDAPVAIGISQPVEKRSDAREAGLQKGAEGRVRFGRFHATAEAAIQDMKDRWSALQSAGMVYAEVCCMEVSSALSAPAR